MASINKNSYRQKILNLPVGSTAQFPVVKLKSIRAMIGDMQRAYQGLRFTTATTPSHIKVTCTARQNNLKEVLNELN